jgi:hypothetical protein
MGAAEVIGAGLFVAGGLLGFTFGYVVCLVRLAGLGPPPGDDDAGA